MRKHAIVLLLLAIGFIAFVFYSLARVEPLKVVVSHLEERGDQFFVQGTVNNTGRESATVVLEVRYYNDRGAEVGRDRIALAQVAAGARADFQGAPKQLEGVTSYSLYIDRGPNPYGN